MYLDSHTCFLSALSCRKHEAMGLLRTGEIEGQYKQQRCWLLMNNAYSPSAYDLLTKLCNALLKLQVDGGGT